MKRIKKCFDCFKAIDPEPDETIDNLSDTFLYKNILNALISKNNRYARYGTNYKNCYFFVGNSGNGKHTLAWSLIQSISMKNKQSGIPSIYLWMKSSDINEIKKKHIYETMEVMFDSIKYKSQENAVFLVMDEVELYKEYNRVINAIGELFPEDDTNIYVIIITEKYNMVNWDLLQNAFMFKCVNPSKKQRENYFNINMFLDRKELEGDRKVSIIIRDYDNMMLARDTEGYSYRELEWLLMCIKAEALSVWDKNNEYVIINKNRVLEFVNAYIMIKKDKNEGAFLYETLNPNGMFSSPNNVLLNSSDCIDDQMKEQNNKDVNKYIHKRSSLHSYD